MMGKAVASTAMVTPFFHALRLVWRIGRLPKYLLMVTLRLALRSSMFSEQKRKGGCQIHLLPGIQRCGCVACN